MGLTQEELGRLIGVTRTIISTYETGRRVPTVRNFVKLAEIFGHDISQSVNHKYYHGQIDWRKLRQQLTYYGFTYRELSGYICCDASCVRIVFSRKPYFSLDCLSKILEIFEDERRLLKFRKELLRRKKRLIAVNDGRGRKPLQSRTAQAVSYGSGRSERRQEESCGRCERVSGKC